ncbi:MAG: helix-turn-helix domain-containing protein [Patescibacteria group bacterium]|nr:helix-turn-helix domain-containing protein [Patescibacteria group bacterium]
MHNRDAVHWALSLDLPATPKLVLLVLAARSNKDWTCWPSLAQICQDSSLKRRAVISALNSLTDKGHIRKTRQSRAVTIYTVIGAPRAPGSSTTITGAPRAPQTYQDDPLYQAGIQEGLRRAKHAAGLPV